MESNKIIICSACLLGIKCRYNGKSKTNSKVIKLLKDHILIPVCPEQIAGFPTPREAVEIKDGRAVDKNGQDLTNKFQYGAEEVLKLIKLYNIKKAILKEKSPSCGKNYIPEGNFCDKVKKGKGITTKLLFKNGIKVLSEEEL